MYSGLRKGLIKLAMAVVIASSPIIIDFSVDCCSYKIKDQRELENVGKRVELKLGIDPSKKINYKLCDFPIVQYNRTGKNSFVIHVGGVWATQNALEYEVYRIYDEHFDRSGKTCGFPNDSLLGELAQAYKSAGYSMFGIKL